MSSAEEFRMYRAGWVFRIEILVFCLSSKPVFRFHSQAAFADLSRGSSPPTYRDLGDMDSAAGPSGIPEAPPSREPRASCNHSDCCDLLVLVSDNSAQKTEKATDIVVICNSFERSFVPRIVLGLACAS